jgi:membrane-associated phospholipid phosphatase
VTTLLKGLTWLGSTPPASGLSLLMALPRIYLGVHWMTYAVGGVALGTLWVTFVRMLDWAIHRPGYSGPRRRAGPT